MVDNTYKFNIFGVINCNLCLYLPA